MSVLIILLYVWQFIAGTPLADTFAVSAAAAIAALFSFTGSIVLYIIAPPDSRFWPGFTILMLGTLTSAVLAVTTGGIASPYVALFMLSVFFAGIFGYYAILPIFIGSGVYVAYIYLAGMFSVNFVLIMCFSTLLPLLAGFVVWNGRNNKQEEQSRREVKNMANQLSEVASTSEVVINAIADGLIVFDAQGTIQLINPAAQQLLGWSKHDALMLNYKSVLRLIDKSNKEIDQAHDPVRQVLNNNQEIRTNDLTILTKNGKKMLASIVVSPIGELGSGALAIFRDITKEKQEEAAQAEFISTASHEMRTPVASIEGYLGLALNPNTSKIDDKAREFIGKAHESAQHLGRLFQDLLDISKADDGRLSNNPKVVDIIPFVGEIVEGLTPKAKEKGLELIYKPKPNGAQKLIVPVYYVNLDNDHIREVTNNLVENAIKYTLTGQVIVDVTSNDDKVIISIKDSGIGIPAEDIPHLFQKFYRVDNEDTRQIGGTGLGLYLCRRLAETMGGRIWVESRYKQGSTFYLELPRIESAEAQELKQRQDQEAAIAAQQQQLAPPQSEPAPSGLAATLTTAAPTTQATAEPSPPSSPASPPRAAPATTVPRGETLTREQIAAHVAKLEAIAKQQREHTDEQPGTNNGGQ